MQLQSSEQHERDTDAFSKNNQTTSSSKIVDESYNRHGNNGIYYCGIIHLKFI